jgi:RNA polymerase sigma factor for flagellar operon FliA
MNNGTGRGRTEIPDLDSLIAHHSSLVERIANQIGSRLPESIQRDDLIQAGMIGLLEALRNYDSSQGAAFETYAGIRIRGSILDEVRRADWTPRSVHTKARKMAENIHRIENQTGRDARAAEVAESMNMTLDEYHQALQDSVGTRLFSIEELTQSGVTGFEERSERGRTPVDGLTQIDFKSALADAISGLPDRERLVVSLYYKEGASLREIGESIGVSESRICQINSQAILRLRARMGEWVEG